MAFEFGAVSLRNLEGVHPDLVKVAQRALMLSETDFRVTCGVRTLEEQKKLVKAGASKTLNSMHLPQADGYAHAIDVAALLDGRVRWDWPLYRKIAAAFKAASHDLAIPIEWGGDWKSFPDGPHFQLGRKYRPVAKIGKVAA